MGRRKRIVSSEDGVVQGVELEDAPADETFAEAKGIPANVHAKKLAKEKSKKAKVPAGVFYTQKGNKVLKMIVKPGGMHSVFIGHAIKHKDVLAGSIKGWKAEGAWAESHEIPAKKAQILASLVKK